MAFNFSFLTKQQLFYRVNSIVYIPLIYSFIWINKIYEVVIIYKIMKYKEKISLT